MIPKKCMIVGLVSEQNKEEFNATCSISDVQTSTVLLFLSHISEIICTVVQVCSCVL